MGKALHQITAEVYLMSHFPCKYDLCAYIKLIVLRETKNIFETKIILILFKTRQVARESPSFGRFM